MLSKSAISKVFHHSFVQSCNQPAVKPLYLCDPTGSLTGYSVLLSDQEHLEHLQNTS